MLKDNATAFSDAGNMLFEPKYEELMAKSLSSRNKSKELFVSIKSQWSTKEGSKRQPFRRGPLFRSRGNRVRGIFEPADQILQQQYLTGGQGRGKNEFLNSTFHQFDEPSVSMSILQSTSTSSEFFSSKNQATTQSNRVKHFAKNFQRLTNDPMLLDIVRGYKIPLFFRQGNQDYHICVKEVSDPVD